MVRGSSGQDGKHGDRCNCIMQFDGWSLKFRQVKLELLKSKGFLGSHKLHRANYTIHERA
eukprot:307924-Chlamydomonas_euryale.AAC.6